MKTNYLLLLLVLFSTLTITSCLEDQAEVLYRYYSDEDYETLSKILDLPNDLIDYHTNNNNNFIGNNNVNNNAALLGRVLFYDHKLSKNEKVSCASCHLQEHGFADKVAFSEGFDGKLTSRNSLSLSVNISTYEDMGIGFFWDERSNSVQAQSKETIENPIEMGLKMDELVDRLNSEDYYQVLFKKAFPGQKISEQTITSALSHFVNSIATFDSRFDQGFSQNGSLQQDFANFLPSENRGKALYIANCQSCHGDITFPGRRIANNGLDKVYQDKGLGERTQQSNDNGIFKIPSLRNIAVSGPFMHDGRFDTLLEVVEHYSNGIQSHPNLDDDLKNDQGEPRQLNFTTQEKNDLVAFLRTLTDDKLIKDERFSTPFK